MFARSDVFSIHLVFLEVGLLLPPERVRVVDVDRSPIGVTKAAELRNPPLGEGQEEARTELRLTIPRFAGETEQLVPGEPVIGVIIGGQAKAYPLRILMWHEIANDTLGGIPLTVTYCPLCNSAIVFDRRIAGMTLDFGTTGKLRNSDLVMYDRQTQSWWQQFLGTAIVGEMTGRSLNVVPSRLESFAVFAERAPDGLVMVAKDPSRRSYGENPYVGYDSRAVPYQFFQGDFPENIAPMARVVAVGKQAWSMALLREKGEIRSAGLIIRWRMGQNSALDAAAIAKGRDVGNVVVSRIENGAEIDVAHDITFAFVFHAFHPDGTIVIP